MHHSRKVSVTERNVPAVMPNGKASNPGTSDTPAIEFRRHAGQLTLASIFLGSVLVALIGVQFQILMPLQVRVSALEKTGSPPPVSSAVEAPLQSKSKKTDPNAEFTYGSRF
jgi:hypothetical protein